MQTINKEWLDDVKIRISDKSNTILKIFYTEDGLEETFRKDQDYFYQQAKLSRIKCINGCHRIIELNDDINIEYVIAESINVIGRKFRSVQQYYV